MRCSLVWIQPLIVWLIVGYVYIIYVAFNLAPQLHRLYYLEHPTEIHINNHSSWLWFLDDIHVIQSTVTQFIIYTLLFHIFFLMFALSYFKAMITLPGNIPITQTER